jgi:hypothetical protein
MRVAALFFAFGLAIAGTLGAAQAAQVRLLCRTAPSMSEHISADSPPTIELDDQKMTATIHMPAEHDIATGSSGPITPFTIGPFPATFTADLITVVEPQGSPHAAGTCWMISRLTGEVHWDYRSSSCSEDESSHDAWMEWTCSPAKAQF